MKILIVSSSPILLGSLKAILDYPEVEALVSSHEEALEKFLTEEPTHVLICEYQEYLSSPGNMGLKGQQTYQDIKNSAANEVIIRLGYSNYGYEDYHQIPFDIKDLVAKLNKN